MNGMCVTRQRNEKVKIQLERRNCRRENSIKIDYWENWRALAALIWRALINNTIQLESRLYNALCFLQQNFIPCSSYMLCTIFYSRAVPKMP
jgi:hypothetical protein